MLWHNVFPLVLNFDSDGSWKSLTGFLALIILGFTLSLDNFRVAVVVGILRPRWYRALRTAIAFGLWDGLAPLVGDLIGREVGERIGSLGEKLGPIVLIGYGIYLAIRSLRSAEPAELDERMALFGLPLSLSLDNLVAGFGLGLADVPPVIPAMLFGITTFLLTFAGLYLGDILSRTITRFVPIRADLLASIGLFITAGTLLRGG